MHSSRTQLYSHDLITHPDASQSHRVIIGPSSIVGRLKKRKKKVCLVSLT